MPGRQLGSGASAEIPPSFRSELTRGEDVVDVATWAGSIPAASGVAPRVRIASKWFNLMWLVPVGFVLLLACGVAAWECPPRLSPASRALIADCSDP